MIHFLKYILVLLPLAAAAQQWNQLPKAYKWLSPEEAAFTYDGTYKDAFTVNAAKASRKEGVDASEKYASFPISPEGAVNLTWSPDSTRLAFTRDNDLYVADVASGVETRLTFDGNDLILNGFASWVYYEEIFGRPSRYRAFWWSPDSRKLAFYRFDNSGVPMFPIYSPKGQDGSLRLTRYPKAGEANPKVKIGVVSVSGISDIAWADFDPDDDCYYGTPFWGDDSSSLYVSRKPRIQNTLDLYKVDVTDGSKTALYHEEVPTWLEWIEGMLFTDKGLYMVRDFETLWQQIYFLSYDGSLSRLTDGPNWRVSLLRVDRKDIYFTAERDSHIRSVLYKADDKGRITALTPLDMSVSKVEFSPDGKYFIATLSNYTTPSQIWIAETARPGKRRTLVASLAGPDFNPSGFVFPQSISITTSDGFSLPGNIMFPKDFDPSKKYPVHMDIYGGPDTPMVRDAWHQNIITNQWWSEHGIIQVTADCRAAGHNGRAALDMIYKQLSVKEVEDFVQWAHYLQSLPYVKADKIGVEGFSFGGTMTALLVMDHPQEFHYGIAGGGVYDWALYDTHYTERFMETPATNPDGYARTRVVDHAANYVTSNDLSTGLEPVMLKLTHGTGDDNVHFQNTLQLVDALQKANKRFEFMIYPDGMHGYRGYQGEHFLAENRAFWLKYLCEE